jgi:hypothetical protein
MPAAKQEIRFDVFISYRRGAADELALLLQRELQRHGLTAFLDRDLRSGIFDDTLLRRIAESSTFLVILSPNALDRCSDKEDWLRKEIVQAISSQRNIIPLRIDSFQFTPEVIGNLHPAVRELSRYQAVEYSRTYFDSTIERIVKIVEEDREERQGEGHAEHQEEVEGKKKEAKLTEQQRNEQRKESGTKKTLRREMTLTEAATVLSMWLKHDPRKAAIQKTALNHYGELFRENLDLTEEEFKSFLLFKNNKHWTGINRQPNIYANMKKLRATLKALLDETRPIQDRLDEITDKNSSFYIKGLGRAVLTPILLCVYPDRYAVYNSISEEGLHRLGLNSAQKTDTLGKRYLAINDACHFIAKQINQPLFLVDTMFSLMVHRDKSPLVKNARP